MKLILVLCFAVLAKAFNISSYAYFGTLKISDRPLLWLEDEVFVSARMDFAEMIDFSTRTAFFQLPGAIVFVCDGDRIEWGAFNVTIREGHLPDFFATEFGELEKSIQSLDEVDSRSPISGAPRKVLIGDVGGIITYWALDEEGDPILRLRLYGEEKKTYFYFLYEGCVETDFIPTEVSKFPYHHESNDCRTMAQRLGKMEQ